MLKVLVAVAALLFIVVEVSSIVQAHRTERSLYFAMN